MSGATHPGAIPGQRAGGVRLNRKFLILAGASLLTLAVIAYGANYWVTGQYQQSTDDAYVGGDVSALAPQVSGQIAQVAVTDNETVYAGQLLVQQGDPGADLYLVLDGVVRVDCDGEQLAEYGPGALLGERAQLEGGIRTSTLVAVTACRVASVAASQFDAGALTELASGHRREEAAQG